MAHGPTPAHWTNFGQILDLNKLWTKFGFQYLLTMASPQPMAHYMPIIQTLDIISGKDWIPLLVYHSHGPFPARGPLNKQTWPT